MLQARNSLTKASAINLDNQSKTYTDKLTRSNPNDAYRFTLKRGSSLDVQVDGVTASTQVALVRDRNRNNRVDRGETLTSTTATPLQAGKLKRNNLAQGDYLLNISTQGNASTNYRLSIASPTPAQANTWSATANTGFLALTPQNQSISAVPPRTSAQTGSIATNRWNTSFLNRNRRNVADFRSYDFSRPNATRDLGSSGASGRIAARLKADFGRGRPAPGVQKDNFAAQAWTRVNLKAGQFYRIKSDSNDGTRFFFRNAQTGQVLTTLNGDWRNRSTKNPEWTQVVKAPAGGQYDFFVQYYERTGASVIDVTLEEIQPTARVIASNGVNLRSQPSAGSNTIGNGLNVNDQFTILREVGSNGDNVFKNWYEVRTRSGQQGFVAADDRLVRVSDRNGVATIGSNVILPPTNPNRPNPSPSPIPMPGGTSDGFVRVSSISFRNSPSVSGGVISTLSGNTRIKILDAVPGDYYGTDGLYDQWYKAEVTTGGRKEVGYIAALYVETDRVNGRFPTGLSKSNTVFRGDLGRANEYKASLEQTASRYPWLNASILAAIGSRESGWGRFLDAEGKGDFGNGHGIMQIDKRYHAEFINSGKWRDPGANIDYAVNNVLAKYYDTLARDGRLKGFDLLRGAIAAYNTGPGGVLDALDNGLDVDAYTTGKDYSWDVISRAGWFQSNGWS